MTKNKRGNIYGNKEGPVFGHLVDNLVKGKKAKKRKLVPG